MYIYLPVCARACACLLSFLFSGGHSVILIYKKKKNLHVFLQHGRGGVMWAICARDQQHFSSFLLSLYYFNVFFWPVKRANSRHARNLQSHARSVSRRSEWVSECGSEPEREQHQQQRLVRFVSPLLPRAASRFQICLFIYTIINFLSNGRARASSVGRPESSRKATSSEAGLHPESPSPKRKKTTSSTSLSSATTSTSLRKVKKINVYYFCLLFNTGEPPPLN